ncbi:MAG: bacterioferritin, partial [Pseudomonadota bacterium]|nr:bacterioferritin [Pseudomonadota bacterium]
AIDLLNESLEHEQNAISLYKELLTVVNGESVYIEEYARGMIKVEEVHGLEIKKMLKDYSQ